ncbi:helix-turn-helix domain-containing protein, partial [Photobacterium toruni]|uniref:helix-turn-helix domain-containing protein n=1 Tax=Photobacterium toruni TaxID=1935446 RepID=UPI001B30CB71
MPLRIAKLIQPHKLGSILVSMKDIAMKFRLYPTPSQENLLARTFGCVRVVYNQILKHRTDAYYSDNEKINYN